MNEIDYLNHLFSLWGTLPVWGKCIAVLFVLHPVASAITAATPTPADDRAWAWLYRVIIKPVALNIGHAVEKNTDTKRSK